mgnify:CR=1 FL=1
MRAPRWFTALLLVTACEGGQQHARSEAAPAEADAPPTFARDIAPIVHAKCAGCHHEGGPAPFALTSYDEVRDHGEQIVDVTARNLMPPWLPSAGKHAFVGERERRLDAAEKSRLAAWVAAGMPAGDLAQVPALPTGAQEPPLLLLRLLQRRPGGPVSAGPRRSPSRWPRPVACQPRWRGTGQVSRTVGPGCVGVHMGEGAC